MRKAKELEEEAELQNFAEYELEKSGLLDHVYTIYRYKPSFSRLEMNVTFKPLGLPLVLQIMDKLTLYPMVRVDDGMFVSFRMNGEEDSGKITPIAPFTLNVKRTFPYKTDVEFHVNARINDLEASFTLKVNEEGFADINPTYLWHGKPTKDTEWHMVGRIWKCDMKRVKWAMGSGNSSPSFTLYSENTSDWMRDIKMALQISLRKYVPALRNGCRYFSKGIELCVHTVTKKSSK